MLSRLNMNDSKRQIDYPHEMDLSRKKRRILVDCYVTRLEYKFMIWIYYFNQPLPPYLFLKAWPNKLKLTIVI